MGVTPTLQMMPTIVLRPIRIVLATVLAFFGVACVPANEAQTDGPPSSSLRHLLIVLDGLRPDYVTPDLMPNLHALGQRGVVFANHHAVYPTVTRVNASSISTGAYPSAHGLLGNSVFFSEVDATRFLSTGERQNLLAVERAEGGRLLTVPTMAEQLQGAGLSLLVVSAGSTGSSFLLNHTIAGGGIIHYDYALPPPLFEDVVQRLGVAPAAATPNDSRNRYVVDAFFDVGLPQIDPTVTLMWLSDPDATAHAHGIGHPTTQTSLARLDAEIGRVLSRLDDAALLTDVNIWVTSDHGFSTHTGAVDLSAVLDPFNGTLGDGSPRIVAGAGTIYVRDNDERTIEGIVATLQSLSRVGAIFTRAVRPGSLDGAVPGTLSLDAASWNHPRSAEILYSANWTDDQNEYGYAGTSAQGGVAGHGSTSPFDVHNVLIAAGPQLRSGTTVDLASGNVDFAPTFLSLLELEVPTSMRGRVLREAFDDGPDPGSIAVEKTTHTVESEDRRYRLTAHSSTVAGHRYLDYTEVVRTP